MPGYEDLVVHLSGVRIGQNDEGRVANVSATLLKHILKEQWFTLTQLQQDRLVSESAPILRREYEGRLRRQYRTKEAARIAIKEEYTRLTQKYKG